MVGKTILHYHILEEVGRGGIGTVYKALDTRLDVIRALKFLHAGLFGIEQARRLLLMEARSQARILHPNIAAMLALETANEGDFLVQEYIDGPDLKLYLMTRDIPFQERLRLVLETACGLGAAHQRGILHRDIKPSNVLISPEGIAKVTDFGLARIIEASSITTLSTITGTVPYMAPECFRGRTLDPRSDVWSLGVMAHEVITGERPFQGENFETVAYTILNDPYPGLPQAIKEQHPYLEQWFGRCLQKEPDSRFSNCEDAYRSIVKPVQEEGIVPLTSTLILRSKRPNRKRYILPILAATCLILISVLLMVPSRSGRFTDWNQRTWNLQSNPSEYLAAAWNRSGERIAYLSQGTSGIVYILDVSNPKPFPHPYSIQTTFRFLDVNWSPVSNHLSVSGHGGLVILEPTLERQHQVFQSAVLEPSWSPSGNRIVFSQRGRGNNRVIVLTLSLDEHDTIHLAGADTVRIEPIEVDPENINYYYPVLILDDRLILFVVMRRSENLGIWSVDRAGGKAEMLVDPSFLPYHLDWDQRTRTLLFTNHDGSQVYGLNLTAGGKARGNVFTLSNPFDADLFDFQPTTGSVLLGGVESRRGFWEADLDDQSPSLDAIWGEMINVSDCYSDYEQTRILFTHATADSGVLAKQLSPGGAIGLAHPSDPRYREESYPTPDPLSRGSLLLRTFDREVRGIYYFSPKTRGLEPLLRDPDELSRFISPVFTHDGAKMLCILESTVSERDDIAIAVRLDRSTFQLSVSGIDTITSGGRISALIPSPDSRTVLVGRYSESGDSLFVLDTASGKARFLCSGSSPTTDATGETLYFISNEAIHRLNEWYHDDISPDRCVPLMDLPSGTAISSYRHARSLAVLGKRLYAILYESEGGVLRWSNAFR
jgi:serine/threonine protein kinase